MVTSMTLGWHMTATEHSALIYQRPQRTVRWAAGCEGSSERKAGLVNVIAAAIKHACASPRTSEVCLTLSKW